MFIVVLEGCTQHMTKWPIGYPQTTGFSTVYYRLLAFGFLSLPSPLLHALPKMNLMTMD